MNEIDTKELLALQRKDPALVVLDCRGPDYWRWERIPSSLNLRWKYISKRARELLPNQNIQIVTYCAGMSCTASTKAYEELLKLGYTRLFEYSGGISEWKAWGMSTENDPQFKIAENIYLFPNQSFYGSAVNCYLIEQDNSIVLIDGPQQLSEEHEDFILNFDKPVQVVLSHAATSLCVPELRQKLVAKISIHKGDKKDQWLTTKPDTWLKGGEVIGEDLRVLHTPGHSPGSITLLDTRNKVLFTGDHLSGTSRGTVFDVRQDKHARGEIVQRLASIGSLLPHQFEAIFPFHYHAIRSEAHSKITEYFKGAKNEKN